MPEAHAPGALDRAVRRRDLLWNHADPPSRGLDERLLTRLLLARVGRIRRLGDATDSGHAASGGPRKARLDGFDLHANVWSPERSSGSRCPASPAKALSVEAIAATVAWPAPSLGA